MKTKCHPTLQLERAVWQAALAKGAANLNAQSVQVFVDYTGDPARLVERGLAVGFHDGKVATGTIRLADLEKLETLEGVTRISLAAKVHRNLDRSVPEIKANLIRSNAPPYVATVGPKAYTGKGVLVGVIDDAIQEGHRSFIKPNPDPNIMETRIVGIWDQIRSPDLAKGQAAPPGFTRGVFWDEATINSVLKAKNPDAIKLSSPRDHGSHVTGIAAGNGSRPDGQFKPYTFVGVAPEADIAFCNAGGYVLSGDLSEALNFIFQLADQRRQSCVINLSVGTHEGARDGSSDLERAIDRALINDHGEPIPGRAVVVAAGNEANMGRHSHKDMAARGVLTFRLKVGEIVFPNGFRITTQKSAGDPLLDHDRIYIWFSGSTGIKIRVTPPSQAPDPAGFVSPGDIKITPAIAIVVSDIPDGNNGKKFITIKMSAPVILGVWTIELQELAGVATPVDLWVDRIGDDKIYPRFVDADDIVVNTITCPCTAQSAIAVGAYISYPDVKFGEHYGDLCNFSSRGLDPDLGITEEQTRPHLVAPGRRIISANNSSYSDGLNYLEKVAERFLGQSPPAFYASMSGTSQAAPHVTGVIALMFERNPNLTYKDIIKIFKTTSNRANIPPAFSTFPNRAWGYGKLDASAALAAVPLP